MKPILILTMVMTMAASCGRSDEILVPRQENKYVNIYSPKGDYFPGPDTEKYLKAGEWYDEWVPNDHCFIKGNSGLWHIYGITHPLTPLDNVHEGEDQSLHAVSPFPDFEKSCFNDAWIDKPKVLTPADRPGEIPQNHAPTVVSKGGLYYMVYGHSPIRFATSSDLYNWTPTGEVFSVAEGARDPNLLRVGNTYYIFYCTERKVGMRSSKNLKDWSEQKIIYESTEYDPESPFMVHHNGKFYLFVCHWNGVNATNDVPGAYQHVTNVYVADKVDEYRNAAKPLTTLNAHAPEVFVTENGQWYISSAEYPKRGINVDKLYWE